MASRLSWGGAALAMLLVGSPAWAAEDEEKRPSLIEEELEIEESAATLRWKLEPGATFRYRVEQDMSVPAEGRVPAQQALMGMDVTWTVAALDDAGTADMRLTIDRLRMKASGYDIDTARPPDSAEKLLLEGLKPLLGAEFRFRLSTRGESADFTQPKELDNARGLLSGGDVNSPVEVLKQLLGILSPAFPESEVASDAAWEHDVETKIGQDGSKRVEMDLTYRGTTRREAMRLEVVDFQPVISARMTRGGLIRIKATTNEASGRLLFDNEAGRLVEFELVELSDMEMSLGNDKQSTQMTNRFAARLLAEDEPAPRATP